MALLLLAMTAPPAAAVPDVWVEGEEVAEAEAAATDAGFVVFLSEPSADDVEVSFTTRDVTATQPADYTRTSGRLTIPSGDTFAIVPVPVLDDTLDELDEDFALDLSDATGATVVGGSDTVTLLDDDPAPTLSIGDGSSQPFSWMEFAITLSAPSSWPVDVLATTVNGTAQATRDYDPMSERVHFSAGQTQARVSVNYSRAGFLPPDGSTKVFYVDLSNPSGAAIGRVRGIGTIPEATRVTRPPGFIRGGPGNVRIREGQAAVIRVRLASPALQPFSLAYSTNPGTAREGSDYVKISHTATIPAGASEATVTVPTVYRRRREPDETFTVSFAPLRARLSRPTATVTILDDPPPRVRSLSALGGRSGVLARFTLSERARVALALQRRVRGRWVAVPGRVRMSGRAGANRASLRRPGFAAGRHRVVVTAVDRQGGRATARVGVRR